MKPVDIQGFWAYLLELLQQRVDGGINRNKLAAELGIPAQTLYAWMSDRRGKSRPPMASVLKLARALGMSTMEILEQLTGEDLADFLELLEKDEQLLKDISVIKSRGTPEDKAKLTADIAYLKSSVLSRT